MKGKIIGIIFCIMLITAAILPVSGTKTDIKYGTNEPVTPPLPGDMRSDKLELIGEYKFQKPSTPDTQPVLYNENIASLIQQVNEEIYLDYLEGLVAFGPRVTNEEACYDSGEYILNEFQEMGIEARAQHWENDERNLHGDNIEATIPGVDETSDLIYVICAHYDSVSGSPGADDDGSGVAAVITAAKVMSSYEFNHTVRFVAFSGEEQGLYGSYYYVQEAVGNNDNIGAALNADMIGFAETDEDKRYVRVYHDDYIWLTDYTTDVSEEYQDFLNLEVIPSGYTWGSDHYRFWEEGYDAIFYAEDNFNDYYHSPEDTIEHMDIDYAVRITRLIIATLADLSEINEINAPNKPSKPTGPPQGKSETEYTYTTSTIDPQEEEVYYLWNWGDGTESGWLGPFESGGTCEASHTWTTKGDYSIKVKAKDVNDAESEWSDPLSVTMPRRGKQFNIFLSTFLEKHPIISRLIQHFSLKAFQ